MLKKLLLLGCLLGCLMPTITSQNSTQPTDLDTTFRVFGLPVLFYTPDTRLGFGAGGITTFYTENARQRSSVMFSFAYTQRDQILLWFPYQIYFGKGKYLAYGEVDWFRYLYQFFGVGNSFDNNFIEKYTAQYPRVRATFLRHLKNADHATGFRIAYDDVTITEYDSTDNGILLEKNITGWNGGRSAGLGWVWWTDARDNRFYASKGWFMEASAYLEQNFTASDFEFFRLQIEASKYFSFNKKTILALNGVATATFGDAPFFNLAALGGTKRLRGYFDGKFRDDHLLMLQYELRRELFWKIGAVTFGGVGTVFGTAGESPKLRPNIGLGLRFQFDKKQKLNIRADYGWGADQNQGFYLTVGEAF